jgi:chromosome segregation ATPase
VLNPKQVDEYKRYFAEFNVLLKGELDNEYKRVAGLIAEWDKRLNLAEEQRKLKQAQEDHAEVVSKFDKQSTKYTTDMKTWHANLTSKEATLNQRDKEVTQKEYAVSDAQAKHEAKVRAVDASQAAKAKELSQKEAELNSLQSDLHKRDKDLSAKHSRVDAVMASMASMR